MKAQYINPESVMEKAIETYGKQNQIMVAIEEMSELTKELSKNHRGNDNISAISEEIADVQITLAQLQMIFNNRDEVGVFWRQKIQRLQKRLEEKKAEELIKNLSESFLKSTNTFNKASESLQTLCAALDDENKKQNQSTNSLRRLFKNRKK